MVAALREAGALFAANSGTSITPVIPASAAANDLMIMVAACNGSTTFSTPTDWSVSTEVESNANLSYGIYTKIHDGSESNPTSTTSATGSNSVGLYGRIYVIKDVNTSNPILGTTGPSPDTTSTPTATSLGTTSAVDEFILHLVIVDDDNSWSSGMPPTPNWTQIGLLSSTTGGDCMMDGIYQTFPGSGDNPGAPTIGTMSASDYWAVVSMRINPASAAAGTPKWASNSALASNTGTARLPGAIATGDVCLMLVHSSSASATITAEPSGWTLVPNGTADAVDYTSYLYKKDSTYAGEEAPSFTFSTTVNWTIDYLAIDPTYAANTISDSQNAVTSVTANSLQGTVTPDVADTYVVSCGVVDATGVPRTWTADNGTELIDLMNAEIHRQITWEKLSGGSGSAYNITHTVTGSVQDIGVLTIALDPPGGGGTATPGVIARSFTMPAATVQAGSVPTPEVIARSVSMPAATTQAGSAASPDVMARVVTMPAVTTQAGSAPTPAAVALSVVMPAATPQAGTTTAPASLPLAATLPAATAGQGADVTPDVIATTVAMPAAGATAGSTATPDVISLAATLPAAAASGGQAGNASPEVIALSVSMPAPATQAGSAATPDVIPLAVTMPAVTLEAGATVTPEVIPLAVTMPAATASGGTSATATPDVISLQATLPAADLSAGSTVTPHVLPLSFTLPQASASGADSGTATPATISVEVTMPAATASGGISATATPATIVCTATMPAATPQAGATATPDVITLSILMPLASTASGETATPTVIPATVSLPTATATGGNSATATPNAIAVVTTLPPASVSAGSTATPGVISLFIVMPPATVAEYIPTEERVWVIAADDRVWVIPEDDRTVVIERSDRTWVISPE